MFIKKYLYIFIFLALVIIAGAYFFYEFEKKRIKDEKYSELSAIAQLKLEQIVSWRSEKIHNANILANNEIIISAIRSYLNGNNSLKNDIVNRLNLEKKEHGYSATALLNEKKMLKLVDKNFDLPDDSILTYAFQQKNPFLSKIFTNKDSSQFFIDLYIPLYSKSDDRQRLIGMIILRRDLNKYLFPLIQSWPTPSRSSETLLFRREGDYVVYLNKLRLRGDKPLSVKLPVKQKNLPASMLARGITGVVEGVDYRGIEVLADLRKVPGSEWMIVTKIDKDELLASLNERLLITLIFVAFLLLAIGSVLGLLWRNQRANYYRKLNETMEESRKKIYQVYERINDLVFGFDKDWNIIYLNETAKNAGYVSLQLNKNIFEQLPRIKGTDLELQYKKAYALQKPVHFEYQTLYSKYSMTLDITAYPSKEGLTVFSRDITEIKRTQDELERANSAVKEAEKKLREVYERIDDMIFAYDKDWNLIYKNKAADKGGYAFLELNKNIWDSLSYYKGSALEEHFKHAFNMQTVVEFDQQTVFGSVPKYMHFTVYPSPEGVTVYTKDLTEMKKAQKELIEANEKITEIVESINDPFYAINSDWFIVYGNEPALKLFNLNKEELLKKNIWELVPKFKGTPFQFHLTETMRLKTPAVFEHKGLYNPGRIYNVHVYPSQFGISVLVRDITEETEAKYQLKRALEDKDLLMKEVHHRVKNSLQLVMSILNLQMDNSSPEIRSYLNDAVHRVDSIASIHSNLYKGENIKDVNLKDYITEIVYSLQRSYEKENLIIIFDLDDFNLGINQATWLGIIINELVSNSFKYAFPNTNYGKININLKRNENKVNLLVHDNGIGFPDIKEKKSSLGFLLVYSLTDQLEGDVIMENKDGAFTKIVFPFNSG